MGGRGGADHVGSRHHRSDVRRSCTGARPVTVGRDVVGRALVHEHDAPGAEEVISSGSEENISCG